jgi:hypothetical protein
LRVSLYYNDIIKIDGVKFNISKLQIINESI